jgi:DsbC/DsbD-like thiol-disulfide interchange protein
MRLSILAAVMLLAGPAAASQTDWQEVTPGVRMRLIADDVQRPDGTTMAGLEIDMPANTKTYWRVPGETGIPTSFDIAASHGVEAVAPVWPYPVIEHAAGYTDYVYYGPTVLPLSLKLSGDAPRLDASVALGICSDVCVPVTARFAMPLRLGKADPAQQIRLQQALALAPIAWTGPGDALGEANLDERGKVLNVALHAADVDPASLIADAGDPAILFGAPQKSPDGRIVTLPLLGGDSAGLEGRPVQLIFLTPMGAYQVTRTIGAVDATAPQH